MRTTRPLLIACALSVAMLAAACGGGSSSKPTPSACEGVTCSGHGTCSVVDAAATCTCDSLYLTSGADCVAAPTSFKNPIIRTDASGNPLYTADPAAMVWDGKVYLYTGHDTAQIGQRTYVMEDWKVFTSTDMTSWTEEFAPGGVAPLKYADFSWATGDAWAGQVIPRNGKFYWYVPMYAAGGRGIGVAVSDSPTGPFADARGVPLITNAQTPTPSPMDYDDIDPTVFIDDDGQAYMYWGNTYLRHVKLDEDMIHVEGEVVDAGTGAIDASGITITSVTIADNGTGATFTEAPWVWKHGDTYYLAYATLWPEKLAYATAPSATGPWTAQGYLQENVPNSNTTHPAIVEINGASYMFYHNGALPQGGEYRRSVCVDRLEYAADGSIAMIPQTYDAADRPGQQLESYNFRQYYARPVMEDGYYIVRFWDSGWWVWPYREMLWVEEPGLADSSEGYVSLRNVGTNTYAYDDGSGWHALLMSPMPAYPTADFKARATFKKVPGLADPTWTSYQSYVDPARYVRHYAWVLAVQAIDPANAGQAGDATFSLHR